jgi:hypothetical protein
VSVPLVEPPSSSPVEPGWFPYSPPGWFSPPCGSKRIIIFIY